MTGILIQDSSDGIWDDGEWISWAWINEQIAEPEEQAETGDAGVVVQDPEILRLMRQAVAEDEAFSTPSPRWGEIGERYAAIAFGLTLVRAHAQGHDGRLGHEFVEIKTITPHKRRAFVRVKRAGNFSLLAVVRVLPDHRVAAKLVRRDQLTKGHGGAYATVSWGTVCRLAVTRAG